MANSSNLPITDIETGVVTSATGDTNWYDTANLGNFQLILIATAKTGTSPTLDWTVYHSYDGQDATSDLANIGGTFTQVVSGTALPNIQVKLFASGGDVTKWSRYIKVHKVIGGTAGPSYTTYVQLKSLSYKA